MQVILVAGACTLLSLWSLLAGPVWAREGLTERANDEEVLRRHLEMHPSKQGGCPDEAGVVTLILAASGVISGVRRDEGIGALIAGITGLLAAFTLWAGARRRQLWIIRLGLAHALLASLLAVPYFIFSWNRDAKVTAVLWFAYALAALCTLTRQLRHPSPN